MANFASGAYIKNLELCNNGRTINTYHLILQPCQNLIISGDLIGIQKLYKNVMVWSLRIIIEQSH
jgi:hypothetical protein